MTPLTVDIKGKSPIFFNPLPGDKTDLERARRAAAFAAETGGALHFYRGLIDLREDPSVPGSIFDNDTKTWSPM